MTSRQSRRHNSRDQRPNGSKDESSPQQNHVGRTRVKKVTDNDDEGTESEQEDLNLIDLEERVLIVKQRPGESTGDFENRVRRERRIFKDTLAGCVQLEDYLRLHYPPQFYDHIVVKKLRKCFQDITFN
jgi:hypothetical protein